MANSTYSTDSAVPEPEPVRERLERELALIDKQWQGVAAAPCAVAG